MYINIYVYTYTYTCIYVYTYMYIRIYVYVYTYTCIHVYTYIHIHVCAADLASWAPACYPGNDVISREIRYLKVCQHVLAKNNLQSGRRWSRLRMSICLRAVRTGSGRRERTNSSRIAPRFFMVARDSISRISLNMFVGSLRDVAVCVCVCTRVRDPHADSLRERARARERDVVGGAGRRREEDEG